MLTMHRAVPAADSPRRSRIQQRHAIRFHSRRFGRRVPFTAPVQPVRAPAISDDLRLFAATFAGGFLFVSILLA
jgi:hypothetical protein